MMKHERGSVAVAGAFDCPCVAPSMTRDAESVRTNQAGYEVVIGLLGKNISTIFPSFLLTFTLLGPRT